MKTFIIIKVILNINTILIVITWTLSIVYTNIIQGYIPEVDMTNHSFKNHLIRQNARITKYECL